MFPFPKVEYDMEDAQSRGVATSSRQYSTTRIRPPVARNPPFGRQSQRSNSSTGRQRRCNGRQQGGRATEYPTSGSTDASMSYTRATGRQAVEQSQCRSKAGLYPTARLGHGGWRQGNNFRVRMAGNSSTRRMDQHVFTSRGFENEDRPCPTVRKDRIRSPPFIHCLTSF